MTIRKGHCDGCPFDYGQPATEMAYNLGCLPSAGEVVEMCRANGTAWACHTEPDKVCCGHAVHHGKPLQHVEGVHYSAIRSLPTEVRT